MKIPFLLLIVLMVISIKTINPPLAQSLEAQCKTEWEQLKTTAQTVFHKTQPYQKRVVDGSLFILDKAKLKSREYYLVINKHVLENKKRIYVEYDNVHKNLFPPLEKSTVLWVRFNPQKEEVREMTINQTKIGEELY